MIGRRLSPLSTRPRLPTRAPSPFLPSSRVRSSGLKKTRSRPKCTPTQATWSTRSSRKRTSSLTTLRAFRAGSVNASLVCRSTARRGWRSMPSRTCCGFRPRRNLSVAILESSRLRKSIRKPPVSLLNRELFRALFRKELSLRRNPCPSRL